MPNKMLFKPAESTIFGKGLKYDRSNRIRMSIKINAAIQTCNFSKNVQ